MGTSNIQHPTLNVQRRLPIVTAAIALAAVAVSATLSLTTLLQFDRGGLRHGQVWRLITGHLTHWSTEHLAWDVLTFVLLGAMAESASRRRLSACLLLSAAAIPVVVVWTNPALATYRGLSGIDSALFALVLADWFWRGGANRVVAILAGIALASKVGFEAFTGQTLFVNASAAGFAPVPAAHAAGGVVGLIVGIVGRRFSRPAVNLWSRSPASGLSGMQYGPAHFIRANTNTRLSS